MEAVMLNVHAVLPAKGTAPNMHLYVAMGVGQGKAKSSIPKLCSQSAALFSFSVSEVEAPFGTQSHQRCVSMQCQTLFKQIVASS